MSLILTNSYVYDKYVDRGNQSKSDFVDNLISRNHLDIKREFTTEAESEQYKQLKQVCYGPISITAFPHCIAMFSHNSRVGLKLWTNLIYRGRLIHILYFVLFLFNLFILGSRDIFSVGRTRVKAASLPRYPTWRANNFPIFNCIT